MQIIEKHRSFHGYQEVYRHPSKTTNCDMQFALYSPDHCIDIPVLYFLSGITCTEQNFIQQPVTTRSEKVNPFGTTPYNGKLTLSPSSDTWFSQKKYSDV